MMAPGERRYLATFDNVVEAVELGYVRMMTIIYWKFM
jgi:hypothetical protein